jgi:hypothetical protein
MKCPAQSASKSAWGAALLCGSAVLALAGPAVAQNRPPVSPDRTAQSVVGQTPVYDPQQLPAYRGQVQLFTLTPRGDIDGLILSDGTEVKTPPHLSTQIAYSVRPGDTVTIHGLHAAALPLIQATSITDEANQQTIVDNGPPGPGRGPGVPPPPATAGAAAGPEGPIPGLTEVQGRVRMALHGPRGEVNGALLDDGAVLRLPPEEAARLANLLQPGQTVVAEGEATVNALGKVLEVRQIGPSREQLSSVDAPPGPRGRPRP